MTGNSPLNTANNSHQQSETQKPLLPRSAWYSQVAYLRALFRVKKALDLSEQEAGVFKSE
jgi:hypothetical protein